METREWKTIKEYQDILSAAGHNPYGLPSGSCKASETGTAFPCTRRKSVASRRKAA